MKSFFVFLGLLIVSLLCGCSTSHEANNLNGGGGTETIGVEWKGSLATTPANPDTNCAYFHITENISYIWSGDNWDTLAVHATDSHIDMKDISLVSLRWTGVRSEAPASPKKHWAYYDRELNGSFIWSNGAWSILTKDAGDLHSFIWKGILATAPVDPKNNWLYYNTTDQMSFKYSGSEWELFEKNALDSIKNEFSVRWKGSLESAPNMPMVNWMYHNKNGNTTYIYTGYEWDIFALNSYETDCAFLDGKTIIWNGTSDGPPPYPQNDCVYFDTSSKTTYLWRDTTWVMLYIDNDDEYNRWKGALESAPSNPERNWCYYNTTTEMSYIYVGTWIQFILKGVVAIEDGGPIVWVGDYAEELVNPQISWLYYNTAKENAYIYNGHQWCLFTLDGVSGELAGLRDLQVRWLGTLTVAPSNPQINDGFLETTTKGCFLWNGDEWAILHIPSQTNLTWLGSFKETPTEASVNDCYFNTTNKKSYMYDGVNWFVFTRFNLKKR